MNVCSVLFCLKTVFDQYVDMVWSFKKIVCYSLKMFRSFK